MMGHIQNQSRMRKKKGRPSKADLQSRRSPAPVPENHRHLRRASTSEEEEYEDLQVIRRASGSKAAESVEQRRRSLRRRSFRYNIIEYDEDYYLDDGDDDDDYNDVELFEDEGDDVEEREYEDEEDEDEEEENGRRRKEKKVKLVVKLSSSNSSKRERVDSEEEDEEQEERGVKKKKKKRRINGSSSEDCNVIDDEENDNDEDEGRNSKVEPKRGHSNPGMPIASSNNRSRTLSPDKKQLELILDKLQKKDTYGVYAEPVDPEELPDYYDIIKHPMDFSTVRKKLANESYPTLELFESDVFLISSNAMQYNAPETIYYKQACAIKELAERKLQRVRTQIERLEKESKSEVKSEPQSELKPVQRERPNSVIQKLSKKLSSRSTQEPVCSEFSSGATLATKDAQNTYSAEHVRNFERHSDNDGLEESISFLVDNCIEKAEDLHSGKDVFPKFGKISFLVDENRRATYNISNQPADTSDSTFIPFEDEKKLLIPVGLLGEYSYARSLSRFTANLGPIAWRLASKRIEQVLPHGFNYGRGWVGEYEPLPTTVLILKDRKEYPLASRLRDNFGSGKNDKRPGCIASGKNHISSPSSSDGKVSSVCGSEGAKPPSPTISVQRKNLLLRASGGPENIILRGSGLSCLSPDNLTNDVAFAKRMPAPRDSVCAESIHPHRIEHNSFSVSNQKTTCAPPRQTPGSREMNSRRMEPNCTPVSIQKTDHVTPKPPSSGMETPSRHAESMNDGKKNLQSFSIKQSDSNEDSRNRMSTNNFVDSDRVIVSSPGLIPTQGSGAAAFFPQRQEHGLSDPVIVMKMLTEKAQRQQNGSVHAHSPLHVRPSISSPRGDGESNACAAAANAWMSVGSTQTPSGNKSQISKDPSHSGKQMFYPQAMQSNVEYPVSTTMHFQHEKNSLPFKAFACQPIKVGNEPQNQNRSMALPSMSTNEVSRFHVHASWRGLSPHTQQKQNTLPPDLNVTFQSVDSQQPDLALQL